MKSFFRQYAQFFAGGLLVLLGAMVGIGAVRYTDKELYEDYYEDYRDSYYADEEEGANYDYTQGESKGPKRTAREEKIVQEIKAPNGTIIQLIEKDMFTYWNDPEATSSEQIVRSKNPQGQVQTVAYNEPDRFPAKIIDLRLSPAGRYLHYHTDHYEGNSDHLVEIATGKQLFSNSVYIDLVENRGVQVPGIFWGENDSFLVLVTYYTGFDGSGINAVRVSEINNIEKLRVAYEFGGKAEPADPDRPNPSVREVRNITLDGTIVHFVAIDSEKGEVVHSYNAATGTLR